MGFCVNEVAAHVQHSNILEYTSALATPFITAPPSSGMKLHRLSRLGITPASPSNRLAAGNGRVATRTRATAARNSCRIDRVSSRLLQFTLQFASVSRRTVAGQHERTLSEQCSRTCSLFGKGHILTGNFSKETPPWPCTVSVKFHDEFLALRPANPINDMCHPFDLISISQIFILSGLYSPCLSFQSAPSKFVSHKGSSYWPSTICFRIVT